MIYLDFQALKKLSVVKRVARIELAPSPWQGDILPLDHTRLFI